jgi:hypothetical protein
MTRPAKGNAVGDFQCQFAAHGKAQDVVRGEFTSALLAYLASPIVAGENGPAPTVVIAGITEQACLFGFTTLPEVRLVAFLPDSDQFAVALSGADFSFLASVFEKTFVADLAHLRAFAVIARRACFTEQAAFLDWFGALLTGLRQTLKPECDLFWRWLGLQSLAWPSRRDRRAPLAAISPFRVVGLKTFAALRALFLSGLPVVGVDRSDHSGFVVCCHAGAAAIAFEVVMAWFNRERLCTKTAVFSKLRHVEPLVRRIRFHQAPGVLVARAGATFGTSAFYHKSQHLDYLLSASGRLRPDQARTLYGLYKAGALVVVARSVDDVVELLLSGRVRDCDVAEMCKYKDRIQKRRGMK